jgi:poly [ADP-ribose] polymerase
MATVIEHGIYSKFDFAKNQNKFWEVWFYDDGTIETRNGRQGYWGHKQILTKSGRRAYDAKLREKIDRKGYKKNEVVDGSGTIDASTSRSLANTEIKDIARKQIKHSNPLVQTLIEFLADVNAHRIHEASGGMIEYDTSTCQFKTSVGVISPAQVAEARSLLVELGDFVSDSDYDNYNFESKLARYLMLVPRGFGMGRRSPQSILPDLNAVRQENDLLDGLDASFAGLQSTDPADPADEEKEEAPKIFDVELKIVNTKSIIDKIDKKFRKTKSMGHVTRNYKLETVYKVDINSMKKAFQSHGKKLTNIMQLWHGTKASNLLSILKQGLVIPPESSRHCTGRMYGDGLYFSSVSTKALNYATGYWKGGGNISRTFMFLADVALGKYYDADRGWGDYPVQGFDSTWAKAGGGTINDEMIVYKLNQANLIYLCEFRDR